LGLPFFFLLAGLIAKDLLSIDTCPLRRPAVNPKSQGAFYGSAVFLVQAAFVVPLGTGAFTISLKFEHAFAAFQFHIGRISMLFQQLFFGHDLGKTAPALGAGGLDSVAFFRHDGSPFSKWFSL
jgi:hypothetical protein